MKSFGDFIVEEGRSIHYFDIDDTLMNTSKAPLKIHVKNEKGEHVQSLSSSEFNTHKLQPGHSYDFSEFRSSKKFAETAKPIRKTLAKMKAIHNNGGRVEMLTARGDMDDKQKFAQKWKGVGVDISKIHVRRAGNIKLPPAEAKASIISRAIKAHGHKEVHLYDDSKDNIDSVLKLKEKHPDVAFHGHHVQTDENGNTTIKHYKA